MTAQLNEISILNLLGDGIGDEHLDEHGNPTDITENMLPTALRRVVAAINERYGTELGHTINLVDFDLSTDGLEGRFYCKNEEELSAYYARMVDKLEACDGRFLKHPTTTPRRDQVESFIEDNDEIFESWTTFEIEKYVQMQMHSPNAKLREAFKLQVLHRPFTGSDETPGLASLPKQITEMDVDSPEVQQFLTEHGGQYLRAVEKLEMSKFVTKVLTRAIEEGKDVRVTTKNTISKLDERFWDFFGKTAEGLFPGQVVVLNTREKAAKEQEYRDAGKVIVKTHLFDSFLPAILDNKHDGEILACLPDQSEILSGIPTGLDLLQELNAVPHRDVVRVATGSGYGERIVPDSRLMQETHTLPEKDIEMSAMKSLKLANEKSTKVIVVRVSENANPVDDRFTSIVKESIGSENCVEMPMKEVLRRLIVNPNDPELQVFLTPNQLGDYLSDMLPGIHYGNLGPAKLGPGVNLNFAYDEAGNLIVVGADPSTGTAPGLVKSEEASRGVLPGGTLLSLAELLKEDPRLPDGFADVGRTLRKAVNDVICEEANVSDHRKFVSKVIDRVMAVAA